MRGPNYHATKREAQFAILWKKQDVEDAKMFEDGKAQMTPITPEPPKWCERLNGEPIIRGDQWTTNRKAGSYDEAIGRYLGEKYGAKAKDGWVHRCAMRWTIRTGEKGFRARYENPEHIEWEKRQEERSKAQAVESHNTPIGETQAKEVVMEETQCSCMNPLSPTEYERLVGRMSLPQLYAALKAHGIKLEGGGLSPKKETCEIASDSNLERAILLLMRELIRARTKHHGYASAHEGISVMREEFEELLDHVKTTQVQGGAK